MGAGLYNASKYMATSDLITIVTPEKRREEPGIGRSCLSQSQHSVTILPPCPGVPEEQVQILQEAEREVEVEVQVEVEQEVEQVQEVDQVQMLQEVEPEEEEANGVVVSLQSPPTHHKQDTKV